MLNNSEARLYRNVAKCIDSPVEFVVCGTGKMEVIAWEKRTALMLICRKLVFINILILTIVCVEF